MTTKQELKIKMMTEIITKLSEGKMEEFVGPVDKKDLEQFVNNVEFIADEIIKRSER